MTGEIVNLRRERKRRARAAEGAKAEQNRISFGLPKVETRQARAVAALAERRLAGHRTGGDELPDEA